MTAIEVLLHLVRLALGKEQECSLPDGVVWEDVETLAAQHGLSAVIVDGVDKLPLEQRPPKPVLLQWIGETLQSYEYRFEQYRKAIAELAGFYNSHGFKMMVLKGYACSLNWPKPEHRPCGDIDIWQFGEQKAADAALAGNMDIRIDGSHHHHTVFEWQGFTVENHYDFINTHANRSSRRFEEKLKELAHFKFQGLELSVESQLAECSDEGSKIPQGELNGSTVYLPGADFNFLFLLRHMANHFSGKEMTLRQLLDWALFIEHHHEEIDWKEDLAFLEANGLLRYFNLMALISVEWLGFSREIFHCELKEDELKERVFNDIIEPEYDTPLGKGALRIMVGKTRRWWSNRWKHRLCYPDSLLSGFVYGVWAKIQKPAHFLH